MNGRLLKEFILLEVPSNIVMELIGLEPVPDIESPN